jgi:hypothetical protein
MTAAGGDRGVLAAAARISDAYAGLSGAMRRVVDQHLIHYPVMATDPKLPGPALPEAGAVQRRAVQLLTAAGGGDLYDAAERLADWAGPALKTAALTRRLEEWLPDTTAVAGPVALTRRLVCDAAGLATTPWSTHAASVAVLDRFAATAMDLADDAELIDEQALRETDPVWGGDTVFEALVETCGFEWVVGRLAVRRNRVSLSRAALLDLGRSATSHEVAQRTGLSAADAALAFNSCDSIVRVGYGRWAAHYDPQFVVFAQVAAELTDDVALKASTAAMVKAALLELDRSDDVGLVDEPSLQAFVAERGWSHRYDALVEGCAMVRVSNRLAVRSTVRAAAKAALSDFGRPATSHEVALVVEMTAGRVAATLQSIASVTRIGPSMWVTDELADGTFVRFGAALWLCSDDVGLIDDTRLSQIANEQQWQIPVNDVVEMCRLPRLHGSLAMADTAAAAAKAALLELQRPATLNELVAITGHSYNTIRNALEGCESVQRVSAATYGHSGLIAVRDPQPAPQRAANPPADGSRRSR